MTAWEAHLRTGLITLILALLSWYAYTLLDAREQLVALRGEQENSAETLRELRRQISLDLTYRDALQARLDERIQYLERALAPWQTRPTNPVLAQPKGD